MNVKLKRIEKGITQAELCRLAKVSPQKMVKIERGDYSTVTIKLGKRIAEILGTTFEELFL